MFLKVLVLSGEEECTDMETKGLFTAITNIVEEEVTQPFSYFVSHLPISVAGAILRDAELGAFVQLCFASRPLQSPSKTGLQRAQPEGVDSERGEKT